MPEKIRQWQDFVIPETIAPPNKRCVVLYIPDEPVHIANFWGNLERLALWWNWEKESTKSGTLAARVWRAVMEQAREDFLAGRCGDDCEDCPPDKDCQSASGSAQVGQLGYTLEELEYMIMFPQMRPAYGYVNGELMWWDSSCCEYKPFPVIEGQAPGSTSPSAITDTALGVLGLQEWAAAGKPSVTQNSPPIPTTIPGYITSDSLACVKATAYVNAMRELFTVVRDGLEESEESIITYASWLTFLTNYLAPGIFAGVMSAASWMFAKTVGMSKDTTQAQINTALDNLDGWNTAICNLVPLMEPTVTLGLIVGNKATEKDYENAVTVIKAAVGTGANVNQIMDTFPIASFNLKVNSMLSDTECGCASYLPYNFEPPLPEGAMRYTFKEFGHASDGFPFPADGALYNAILVGGARGEMFGGNPSTQGIENDGTNYSSFLQAVFEFTAPVTISRVKLFFTYPNGAPSNYGQWSNMLFTTDGGGQWKYGAGWGNYDENPEQRDIAGQITAFSAGFRTSHAGSYRKAVLSSVLISGTFLGDVFTDLPPDTIFET